MTEQHRLSIQTRGRGTTEITDEIAACVATSAVNAGLAHIFVRHTSCGIAITENADPSVRRDLETLMQRWAPDGDPAYRHDMEGDDDMAAHGRNIVAGSSVTVPISNGKLTLGTWQGIFLWEHRTTPHRRRVVITVLD